MLQAAVAAVEDGSAEIVWRDGVPHAALGNDLEYDVPLDTFAGVELATSESADRNAHLADADDAAVEAFSSASIADAGDGAVQHLAHDAAEVTAATGAEALRAPNAGFVNGSKDSVHSQAGVADDDTKHDALQANGGSRSQERQHASLAAASAEPDAAGNINTRHAAGNVSLSPVASSEDVAANRATIPAPGVKQSDTAEQALPDAPQLATEPATPELGHTDGAADKGAATGWANGHADEDSLAGMSTAALNQAPSTSWLADESPLDVPGSTELGDADALITPDQDAAAAAAAAAASEEHLQDTSNSDVGAVDATPDAEASLQPMQVLDSAAAGAHDLLAGLPIADSLALHAPADTPPSSTAALLCASGTTGAASLAGKRAEEAADSSAIIDPPVLRSQGQRNEVSGGVAAAGVPADSTSGSDDSNAGDVQPDSALPVNMLPLQNDAAPTDGESVMSVADDAQHTAASTSSVSAPDVHGTSQAVPAAHAPVSAAAADTTGDAGTPAAADANGEAAAQAAVNDDEKEPSSTPKAQHSSNPTRSPTNAAAQDDGMPVAGPHALRHTVKSPATQEADTATTAPEMSDTDKLDRARAADRAWLLAEARRMAAAKPDRTRGRLTPARSTPMSASPTRAVASPQHDGQGGSGTRHGGSEHGHRHVASTSALDDAMPTLNDVLQADRASAAQACDGLPTFEALQTQAGASPGTGAQYSGANAGASAPIADPLALDEPATTSSAEAGGSDAADPAGHDVAEELRLRGAGNASDGASEGACSLRSGDGVCQDLQTCGRLLEGTCVRPASPVHRLRGAFTSSSSSDSDDDNDDSSSSAGSSQFAEARMLRYAAEGSATHSRGAGELEVASSVMRETSGQVSSGTRHTPPPMHRQTHSGSGAATILGRQQRSARASGALSGGASLEETATGTSSGVRKQLAGALVAPWELGGGLGGAEGHALRGMGALDFLKQRERILHEVRKRSISGV